MTTKDTIAGLEVVGHKDGWYILSNGARVHETAQIGYETAIKAIVQLCEVA